MKINWFMLIFSVIIPAASFVGMAVILIKDAVKKKRREKRNHCEILYWWDLKVE